MNSPRPQGWRIDKHIPVAVIVTIVLQTAGVVWWASGINYRIAALESVRDRMPIDSEKLDGRFRELDGRLRPVENDVGAIKKDVENIKGTTDRIEKKLDKISALRSPVAYEPDYLQLSLAELSETEIS